MGNGPLKLLATKIQSIAPGAGRDRAAPRSGARRARSLLCHPGKTLGFDELKQFLATRQIAKFMWPEQLEIVTDMPLTPTRKVIKGELVRHLLEHASGRSAA